MIAQGQYTIVDLFDGESLYTWVKYADTSTGSGLSDSPTGKLYMGVAYNKTTPTESTNAADYTWSLIKGSDGATGPTGPQGPTGSSGKGISSITEYYLAYTSNSGVTTATAGWTTTVQTISSSKRYLWNYERITYTDSTTNTTTPVVIGVYGDTGPQGLQGIQGPQGNQGIQGPAGNDGLSSYTHIAYATNSTGTAGFSTSDPVGKTYIGMYVDNVQNDSTDPTKYKWSLIKGADGAQGIQGPAGTNGQTPYLHIAYATNSTGTADFSTTDATGKTYIGTYTDFTAADSTDPTKYKWSLIKGTGVSSVQEYYLTSSANSGITTATAGWQTTMQSMTTTNKYLWNYEKVTYTDASVVNTTPVIIGVYGDTGPQGPQGPTGPQGIQGPIGPSGTSQYVHIRYSTASNGNPMTTTPDVNTKYIGLANTTSSTAPSTYTSYTWTLIKGADGSQGIQGPAGVNGQTTYTWVKYADDVNGSGLTDTPAGKRYIGLAFNKTTATETTNAADYSWSPLFDNVVVGGGNLIVGSDLSRQYIANPFTVGGVTYNTYQSDGLAGYNSGVTNPTTSYHAYVDNDTFKFPVICYNESDGTRNWKAGTNDINNRIIEQGGTYVFSVDAYATDIGTKLFGGFYYTKVGGTTQSFHAGQFRIDVTTTGKWVRVFATCDLGSDVDLSKSIRFYIYGYGFTTNSILYIRKHQLEKGNIPTDWKLAVEDVLDYIDDKASTDDLDSLAGIISDVSAIANSKAGMGELQAMQEAFDARVAQDIKDKDKLANDLATLEGRTALVEQIAGNAKLVTTFIETVITESNEGIYIAKGSSNTGILIGTSRISFMDNGVEVAYISNQTMQINHGIFVESATISDFKFEKIPGTTILGITWVGG